MLEINKGPITGEMLAGRFDLLDKRFDNLDRKIDGIDKKIDTLANVMDQSFEEVVGITKQVHSHIGRIDKKIDGLSLRELIS